MPSKKIRKLKVLIANDNQFQLLIVSSNLSQMPIVGQIDQASNGQEALEMVKKSMVEDARDPYDLILLDLDMPIMNGYDAC